MAFRQLLIQTLVTWTSELAANVLSVLYDAKAHFVIGLSPTAEYNKIQMSERQQAISVKYVVIRSEVSKSAMC